MCCEAKNSLVNLYPPESNCIGGFPTIPVFHEDSIARTSSAVTVLIPEMNFTCSQRILAFYFGGTNRQGGQQDPMIQIWRENSSMPGNYYKIERPIPVNISDIVCADGLPRPLTNPPSQRSFLCILNKDYQVSVEPGDILGLEIPSTDDDDFDIWFTSGGPLNYIFDTELNSTIELSENSTTEAQLPQISFEFTSGTKGHHHNDVPVNNIIYCFIIQISALADFQMQYLVMKEATKEIRRK